MLVTGMAAAARAAWAVPVLPVYAARAGCARQSAMPEAPIADWTSVTNAAAAVTRPETAVPAVSIAAASKAPRYTRPLKPCPAWSVRSVTTSATSGGCALPPPVPAVGAPVDDAGEHVVENLAVGERPAQQHLAAVRDDDRAWNSSCVGHPREPPGFWRSCWEIARTKFAIADYFNRREVYVMA